MMPEPSEKPRTRSLATVLIGIALVALLVGGVLGYAMSNFATSDQINNFKSQISNLEQELQSNSTQIGDLQTQIGNLEQELQSNSTQISSLETQVSNLEQELQAVQNSSVINISISGMNVSLSQLYDQVSGSIVMVQGIVLAGYYFGTPVYGEVEGSGFVTNMTGQFAIVTNYHVVEGAANITVTFTDGDTYSANVTGTDLYSDLATLSTTAPESEYHPLTIVSSSTLQVGDPVFAVGNPLGLTGSMTSGIVSALHRSVTVDWTTYAISDCIQTSAPINPGNSGGPLLNYAGEVVGITSYTATYEGVAAQGLGLAIPSSSILREVPSLIINGSYSSHPYLGADGVDMSYELAQAMNTTVTYGWLISDVTSGGPAATAGLEGGTTQFTDFLGNTYVIGGDIIIAFNGTRIANGDAMSSYMEENTLPGQTVNATIVRNNQTINVAVTLGSRPPPA
ncbi:MAG: trypsin-like peptidase domain-containing protein [Candidatus Bathyarchaeia archaeon]|jgi:S1-C subfamily serine protease